MPPLLPQDKANHGVYGALIAAVVLLLSVLTLLTLRKLGVPTLLSPHLCVMLSVAVSILFAWWKEWVYDAAHADVHTVDVRDFWATVAGALLVNLPAFLLACLV